MVSQHVTLYYSAKADYMQPLKISLQIRDVSHSQSNPTAAKSFLLSYNFKDSWFAYGHLNAYTCEVVAHFLEKRA